MSYGESSLTMNDQNTSFRRKRKRGRKINVTLHYFSLSGYET
jgi:hypothetical protein